MKPRKTSFKSTIKAMSRTDEKKASRQKLPVAISENGQAVLVFPDGTQKPFTPATIAALTKAS